MATRRKAKRILTGIEDLDQYLKRLRISHANTAARHGLRVGARLAVKLVKQKIPGAQKRARKAIGYLVKRDRGGVTRAKAGAAVGKKQKPVTHESRGLGIGAANIHWLILGTGDREQRSGRATGSVTPNDWVKQALSGKQAAIASAIEEATRKKLKQVLERERKRRKRRKR